MPYEPDTASEKHREGEREVRHTIIRIIRDHLQDPSAPTTWCGLDLNFTNATFDGGDFTGAEFTGGEVSFGAAKFTGDTVSFHGAKLTGGAVFFYDAKFTGSKVSFYGTEFTTDCSIVWGPFEPPAAWTALQESERRQNEPPGPL